MTVTPRPVSSVRRVSGLPDVQPDVQPVGRPVGRPWWGGADRRACGSMLAIEDWIERASAGEASAAWVVVYEPEGRPVAEPQWKHPVVRGDHVARHAREVFKGRARSAA